MPGYAEKPFYDRLVLKFDQLKTIRQPYEEPCDEIIDYYRPDMVRFSRKEGDSGIELLGEHVFEGTPAKSARIMSEGWQGYLVSRSIEWVKHQLEDMKGIDEVNKWLQELDDYMYSVYKNSTLYDNIGMFCLDGVTVGSPVVIIEEDERTGKVHHQVPHPAGRYFGNNAFGETDTLYLYRERSVKEAYELYGRKKRTENGTSRDNDGFTKGLKRDYREGNFSNKYKFIKCFHHFMDPIFENVKPEFKPVAPWMAYTIQLDNTDKKVCKIERYWSKSFVDWPFEKRIGRAYATTPAWWSYYDTLSLQDAREGLLMSGKIKNRPPMFLPAFMKATMELYPEGLNFYSNPTQQAMKPEAIIDGGDYPVGKDMEDQLRLGVEDWFHVKFFLMLSQWSMQQKAPPTAYHIMQMMGERAVLLAPRIGNFTRRLEEMDDRMIDIEQRAGRLPEPPPIVMEMSEGKLKPEFIGPLAQVQQQYHETRRMEATMLQVQPFINLDPMSARKIKAEVAIEHILEKNRFIQDAITSQEEYDEYVRAAAQQQQMREAVQLGTEVAKAIPSVSKDIEKNSPIALLSGAGAGAA